MMSDPAPPGHGPAPDVRATIDHVRRLLDETTTADDLAARAGEVRERLRRALEAVEASARTGGTELLEAASAAQRSLTDELADAERKIRENPLGAVLVAAGIGLVLGLLVRRR
jgi:ElaB/YqjD/DUF883 family membrane-anchored ribosome-binding protein